MKRIITLETELTLKEQLSEIDGQIDVEKEIYELLSSQEEGYKSRVDDYEEIKDNWALSTINREKEIFNNIHKLQEAKLRLITGEKNPEIIYIDREIPKIVKEEVIKVVEKPVIQYVDRHTKYTHVYKPGLTVSALWFLLMFHGAALAAWYYGLINIVVKTNF